MEGSPPTLPSDGDEEIITNGEVVAVEGDEEPKKKLSGFADPAYWTPERRRAQSERAKRMIAEGRFGGPGRGQGRKKVKSATQLLAEKAAERAEKIDRKLNGMLDDRSKTIQAMGIDRYLAAEAKVEKDMREDERDLGKLTGEELNEVLMGLLAEHLGVEMAEEDNREAPEVTEIAGGR